MRYLTKTNYSNWDGLSKSHAKKVWGPKLSLHGIYIPNGCKHFKIVLQLFYGIETNSNKPLKNLKKSLELRD